jgi:alanyl-tRNA synthetase
MTRSTTPISETLDPMTEPKTADQIRRAFLRYFEERDHRVVPSASLVPANDPTLLFSNAGMNQFKDVFLGREKRDYVRAASSQKCVRAGGKHNDLENVGRTARHHTFFEMLGNFSFGDYFKQDAIAYAWEFLTRELSLDPRRLEVTVFAGDADFPRDEAARKLWREHVADDRILELGVRDNFWAMGDTGPCGPCSEVHCFQSDALLCDEEAAGRKCLGVECECDRWLEVWNLVFMQYERGDDGVVRPLPAPCIDTGMGLERIAAVVQGRESSYDTDLFAPLIQAAGRLADREYGRNALDDVSLRVIADHLRALTFLIADGVLPGNEGRGYVLRKIMRRAMRHGRRLGIEKPFLGELIPEMVELMASAFPELRAEQETIRRVAGTEEERFGSTLKQAIAVFEEIARGLSGGDTLRGADAFRLYDTYGLALDFTEELAAERGLVVDREGYDRELAAQQERARQASRMGAVKGDPVYMQLLEDGATEFLGYDDLHSDESRVLAVLRDGALVTRLDAGQEGEIVLDRTPFYAEAGGQVGDHGAISSDGSSAEVVDTRAALPGLYVHRVEVGRGGFERGMQVRAQVDGHRRARAMRNHTGTHLLHAALREVLGPHVKQAGSLVAPDRLRFDFSHFAGVSDRELRHIENRVNSEILRDAGLETKVMGRDEALAYGALAFFGDKYGERVRVVEVPGFSKEFCGGTHVHRTGEIGLLLLTNEQGVSAGTRRVEAVTGDAALERARQDQGILEALEKTARTDRRSLVDEYARLQEQLKALQRENEKLKLKLASDVAAASAGDDLIEAGEVLIWTPRFDGLSRKAHAAVVDEFRNEHRERSFALLSLAVEGGSVHAIAAVAKPLTDRLKAGEILKRLELRGGGRPDFAQGGGAEPAEVEPLRQRAAELLKELVGPPETTGA